MPEIPSKIRFNAAGDMAVVTENSLHVHDPSGHISVSLRSLLPPTPAPLQSDNTPAARAKRAPAYSLFVNPLRDLADLRPIDILPKLIQALFSARPSEEWFRIEVPPQITEELTFVLFENGLAIPSPDGSASALLLRESYWQGALAPRFVSVPPSSSFPLVYTYTQEGRRHPIRQPKPKPGTLLYERFIPHLQETFTLRVVDPGNEQDVKLFSDWQNVCNIDYFAGSFA
jgi:N5-hydroxy-L-ornithine N5-transacylase